VSHLTRRNEYLTCGVTPREFDQQREASLETTFGPTNRTKRFLHKTEIINARVRFSARGYFITSVSTSVIDVLPKMGKSHLRLLYFWNNNGRRNCESTLSPS
jgi:hypothetical protein